MTKGPAATIRVSPGSTRLQAAGKCRLPGVFLVGLWTDTGWPPARESAVRSGAVAAEAALRLNGSRVKR